MWTQFSGTAHNCTFIILHKCWLPSLVKVSGYANTHYLNVANVFSCDRQSMFFWSYTRAIFVSFDHARGIHREKQNQCGKVIHFPSSLFVLKCHLVAWLFLSSVFGLFPSLLNQTVQNHKCSLQVVFRWPFTSKRWLERDLTDFFCISRICSLAREEKNDSPFFHWFECQNIIVDLLNLNFIATLAGSRSQLKFFIHT